MEVDWDEWYRSGSQPWEAGRPEPELVRLLSAGKLPESGRALDLGCGAGTHSIYLAQQGFEVTALDISLEALDTAKRRAQQEKVHIDFITGQAQAIDFTGEFDLVFDRGCFHHIPEQHRQQYITAVSRALKPDGSFLLLCFSDANRMTKIGHMFSEAELRGLFGGLFTIKEMKETVHTEPQGGKVILWSVLMVKKH